MVAAYIIIHILDLDAVLVGCNSEYILMCVL